MITIINEEQFDLDEFIQKEGITLYRFAVMTEMPKSTIYGANNGERRMKKADFDKMMANYEKNKVKQKTSK